MGSLESWTLEEAFKDTVARFDRIGWIATAFVFTGTALLGLEWWPAVAWSFRFLGDATWAFAGWWLGSRSVMIPEGAFAVLDLVVLASILIGAPG